MWAPAQVDARGLLVPAPYSQEAHASSVLHDLSLAPPYHDRTEERTYFWDPHQPLPTIVVRAKVSLPPPGVLVQIRAFRHMQHGDEEIVLHGASPQVISGHAATPTATFANLFLDVATFAANGAPTFLVAEAFLPERADGVDAHFAPHPCERWCCSMCFVIPPSTPSYGVHTAPPASHPMPASSAPPALRPPALHREPSDPHGSPDPYAAAYSYAPAPSLGPRLDTAGAPEQAPPAAGPPPAPRTAREKIAILSHSLTCGNPEGCRYGSLCVFVREASQCPPSGVCGACREGDDEARCRRCATADAIAALREVVNLKAQEASHRDAAMQQRALIESKVEAWDQRAAKLRGQVHTMRGEQARAQAQTRGSSAQSNATLLKLTLLNDQAGILLGRIDNELSRAQGLAARLGDLDREYGTCKPRLDGLVWAQVLVLEDLSAAPLAAAAAARVLALQPFLLDDARRLSENTMSMRETSVELAQCLTEVKALYTKAQQHVRDAEPSLLALQHAPHAAAFAPVPAHPTIPVTYARPLGAAGAARGGGKRPRPRPECCPPAGAPAWEHGAMSGDPRKAPRSGDALPQRRAQSDTTASCVSSDQHTRRPETADTTEAAAAAPAQAAFQHAAPAADGEADPLTTLATAASAQARARASADGERHPEEGGEITTPTPTQSTGSPPAHGGKQPYVWPRAIASS